MSTSLFILVEEALGGEDMEALCRDLENVEGITQAVSVSGLLPSGFDLGMLPEDIAQLAQSGGKKLILANSAYKSGTGELTAQLKAISSEAEGYVKRLTFEQDTVSICRERAFLLSGISIGLELGRL